VLGISNDDFLRSMRSRPESKDSWEWFVIPESNTHVDRIEQVFVRPPSESDVARETAAVSDRKTSDEARKAALLEGLLALTTDQKK
jgi:hypothetical protein